MTEVLKNLFTMIKEVKANIVIKIEVDDDEVSDMSPTELVDEITAATSHVQYMIGRYIDGENINACIVKSVTITKTDI